MRFPCCVGGPAMNKEEALERIYQVAAYANREGFELSELKSSETFMRFLTDRDDILIHTPYGAVKLIL
jgi:hypothetical protein